MTDNNVRFAGSVPGFYHHNLGPLFFEPYAEDLAARFVTDNPNATVLELAAGTGILTRQLRRHLPDGTSIIAIDLNEAMLAVAKGLSRDLPGVQWRQADATALPFNAGTFDAVVCQFGWMFFSDKVLAAREALRVLRPGGQFLFNVWGSLATNPVPNLAHTTIGRFFDHDPPTFYLVPFGFDDMAVLRETLSVVGFNDVTIDPVAREGVARTAEHAAIGLVRGNPSIFAIEERATASTDTIISTLARNLSSAFGDHPLRAPMFAFVIAAKRAR